MFQRKKQVKVLDIKKILYMIYDIDIYIYDGHMTIHPIIGKLP